MYSHEPMQKKTKIQPVNLLTNPPRNGLMIGMLIISTMMYLTDSGSFLSETVTEMKSGSKFWLCKEDLNIKHGKKFGIDLLTDNKNLHPIEFVHVHFEYFHLSEWPNHLIRASHPKCESYSCIIEEGGRFLRFLHQTFVLSINIWVIAETLMPHHQESLQL